MKKILVIEDEPSVRANIIELLEAEDFNVISAENGFSGALCAHKHLPNLIICDVMMPNLNGYDVLTALQQNPVTATIPFIFLTANADKADIRRGMKLGADDYITKPFKRDELLDAIATRFVKHEAVMHHYATMEQRAEALQQKVQELQQSADTKGKLLNQFQQELHNAVPKLNLAIKMLKNLQPGTQRDRCMEILQEACNDEIALLNKLLNLQGFLMPDNVKFLHQINIINGRTD